MRKLCALLLLIPALASAHGLGQQVELLDAPEPAFASPSGSFSPSSSASRAAAIVPVRPPAAEPKQRFTRTDWALLGAGATLRFFDYKSTVRMTSDPVNFREVELPQALVHNRPALGAFEASTVVANYFVYRLLVGHRHRKLARVGQSIYVSTMGATVGWNYYELNAFWPKQNLLHGDHPGKH